MRRAPLVQPASLLCLICGRGATTYFYEPDGTFVGAYCHEHARSRMRRARMAPPDFVPRYPKTLATIGAP